MQLSVALGFHTDWLMMMIEQIQDHRNILKTSQGDLSGGLLTHGLVSEAGHQSPFISIASVFFGSTLFQTRPIPSEEENIGVALPASGHCRNCRQKVSPIFQPVSWGLQCLLMCDLYCPCLSNN